MFSKYQNWLRHNLRNSRFKYAAILSFVVLVVLFGVVQAGGPTRPKPPHRPGMGHMGPQKPGMWGKMVHYWRPATTVPTIKIIAVVEDESVTFETRNFPADEDFTVTMGKMYTRGINGIEVGSFNSGDGGKLEQTFEIPEELFGSYKISIRASTDHAFPYFAYNWFYNNSTEPKAVEAEEPSEEEAEEPSEEEAEEPSEEEAEEPSEEEAEEMDEGDSIAAIAAADGRFTTLVAALEAAELAGTLDGEGEFTVFAPTDDAFDALPDGTVETLLADPTGDLTTILLYHVVDGVVLAETVVTLESAETLQGEEITIAVVDDEVVLNDSVKVIETDIEASNGVLHVIDAVLMPPSLSEEGEEAPDEEAEEEPSPLVGQVWQWEEFSDPINGTQVVDGPEKYLIEFLPEGGINIQADCNVGTGTYTADEDGSLSISIGAMTLALCEPESLSDQFVNNLSAAAAYFFAEDDLFIDLSADAGTMMFGPNSDLAADVESGEAGTGGAETEEGAEPETDEGAEAETDEGAEAETDEGAEAETDEGEEAETDEGAEAETDEGAEAETEEGEEAETEEGAEAETEEGAEAETEEGAEAETEEGAEAETGLVGAVWQWSEFTDPVQGTVEIEDSELYTAEFLDDGTVNVQADCNSGRGNYTLDGSSITISELAMTRALCAPESLSDQYVEYLSAAAIYFFEEDDLFFDLPADSGTMRFMAEAEESTAATRGSVYKVVRQDDEEEEDPVPSFTVCTVVANESVSIVTENFPADQEFTVQMGPVPMPMPMPGYHGPAPYGGPKGKPAPGRQPAFKGKAPVGPQPPGKGMPEKKGMWGKSMGPQKVWIPYYEAGTLESGDGGELEATFDIPADFLYGAPKISIVLRTDHDAPYIAYNWFYNNDAEVCEDNDENGD